MDVVGEGRAKIRKLELGSSIVDGNKWQTGTEIQLKGCCFGMKGAEGEWRQWRDI